MTRHPAAMPAANIAPTIQPEEKPISLGSRRRSSRLRFGIWDSGPSHSSSDERIEPLLKRMVVFLSLMIPLLPCKPAHAASFLQIAFSALRRLNVVHAWHPGIGPLFCQFTSPATWGGHNEEVRRGQPPASRRAAFQLCAYNRIVSRPVPAV